GSVGVAMEPAGPALSLAERVWRLYGGLEMPIATFTPDGSLLYATLPAHERFGSAASLAALGLDSVAAGAMAAGQARATMPFGSVTIERIGADAATVLVATFAAAAATEPTPPPASPVPDALPPPPPPSVATPTPPEPTVSPP